MKKLCMLLPTNYEAIKRNQKNKQTTKFNQSNNPFYAIWTFYFVPFHLNSYVSKVLHLTQNVKTKPRNCISGRNELSRVH